ncbi:hypothetical protein KUTeg_013931 [Tegillarca granosa]|uniref:YqaJ viral recombinase domain-containing protein n=1 Tax=Tegillarca granosa TaxID=220873 RepID=A0ABQ9EZK9_TEGGR|nr:hypothetical protein KUTeg_013931 [Tegillarca granosa]
MVTGSTIYQALGLDGLKKQKAHFDKVVCGIAEPEKSPEIQNRLDYGTKNEINAITTLVSKVLPVLYPDLVYEEVGCYPIYDNDKIFMVVSPDGKLSFRENPNDQCAFGIEFKCPTEKLHTSVPARYVLQCLSETAVLQVDQLLYVCWRPDFTTVFKVRHNEELFNKTLALASDYLATSKPNRPIKLSEEATALQKVIADECKKYDFLGEFKSVKMCEEKTLTNNKYHITLADFRTLLHELKELTTEAYELKREKASEAMVFLCSDLDRNWAKDSLRWSPVCWFPKGPSLTSETLRKIVEKVHDDCHSAVIHIPAESFDGQWHNIVVRTFCNKPLTLFQLKRDFWSEVQKLNKADIIKEFSQLNKDVKLQRNDDTGSITLSNNKTLPEIRQKCWESEKKMINKTTLDDVRLDRIANIVLTEEDKKAILISLQSDVAANKKGQWDKKSVDDVTKAFADSEELRKLRDIDLRVVLRYFRGNGKLKTKDSVNKETKIQDLCSLFGIGKKEQKKTQAKCSTKRMSKPIHRLSEIAINVLKKKVPKSILNIAYAEYKWPDKRTEWESDSPLNNNVKIHDSTFPDFWFYVPEYSESRKQLEVRCIDSTHLLTRLRRVTCKGGIEGLDKKPWLTVAKQKTTSLTVVMVEDIVDPMSCEMALTHFSEEVENAMLQNGDSQAASLCNDIRTWWDAEDRPGIPAGTRILMRSRLRSRLISYFQIVKFPPQAGYVNGCPSQLWEALISNIDAKSILFALCRNHSYNVRAFSSMMGETFFFAAYKPR